MKKVHGILGLMLAFALIASMMTGCGASSSKAESSSTAMYDGMENGYYDTAGETAEDQYNYAAEPQEAPYENGVDSGDADLSLDTEVLASTVERKLTYTADVYMETKTYREAIASIEKLTSDSNGYVSYSNITDYGDDEEKTYSRSANFSIQIPAGALDGFISALAEFGNVTSTSKQVNDITQSYYDTQSRLDALKEQEQRLLDMQAKAEALEDMLEIEGYLSNVRSEINYLYNMMQVYEQQVSYSTVNLNLSEVVDYTPAPVQDPTFGDRIVQAFGDMFAFMGEFGQGLVIVLIFLLPFLLIAAIVVVIVVLCVRAKRKKRAKLLKEHPELAKPAQPAMPPVYPYPYPAPQGQPTQPMPQTPPQMTSQTPAAKEQTPDSEQKHE